MLTSMQWTLTLDHLQQGILIIAASGEILAANLALEALLGLSPDHLGGKPAQKLSATHIGFLPEEWEQLLYQLQTGDWSVQQRDKTFRSSEAHQKLIRRSAILLAEDESPALLLRFSDVTELQELRLAQEQFVSMIVHDLRSPLTALTSSMRLLSEITDSNPHDLTQRTTQIAQRAVKKLLNMVNSLLDMFKLERDSSILEREWVDIGELLGVVVAELKPLADEMEVNIETFFIGESIPLLQLDADKIERVLYNLIDNAIKFTPSEGLIRVQITQPGPEALILEVQDNGSGIPLEYRSKIFDPYQQVEEHIARRRGTGLGLTFCKLAMEAHGGQIWIEDNPMGGTIFALSFPLAR